MDWKKTFNRGQWVIHAIFLAAVIFGIGCTLFALRLNNLQVTEEERGLKASSLVNYLKTDNSFEKVGKYLTWSQTDKAHDKMKEFSRKLAETEELVEMKASKELSLGLRTFNKLISSGSGMSDPGDVIKVLKQKADSLEDVAKSQGYKNVSIIAERMKTRLGQLTNKTAASSVQVSYLKSDLDRLNQLVSSSTLDEGKKVALKARFDSMKNELDLLISLSGLSKDLKVHITQASLALGQWMIDVEKKASDLKGFRLRKQNHLIVMLGMMCGFLLVAWMGLAYLFRWQKSRIGDQVELEVKNVIAKGIIEDQRFMMDHYSEGMREDIVRLLDELKIKLNLGSMLHEGLPFAGCMVDKNFKLTWHNQLFCEQLYLSEEEIRSDAFNWDYVRDYLNLEEDPIYQALVNKIAGIYPVKVKQDEFTFAQPYEMYVTPITANREDRVMVFFYPLVSVKEAISEQVNLTRSSIEKFMALWNEEKIDQDELRTFERDFKKNDLIDLYKNLISVYERVEAEKSECISTIRTLEKELSNLESNISQVRKLEEEKKGLIKKEFKLAHELQESFIHTIEKGESLIQINKTVLLQNDDLRGEAQRLYQMTQEFIKKNKEQTDMLTQLESVKVDYKKLKFELLEVKAKLISLNNSLFAHLPPLDEQQQKLATRYKDELARLDFNVSTFDKKLSQLDVLLGKMAAMHDKVQVEQTNFNFQTTQRDHELKEALGQIQRKLSHEEGIIVESFKSLHQLMRKDLEIVNESHDLTSKGLDGFLS